jgi:hypothetical protein
MRLYLGKILIEKGTFYRDHEEETLVTVDEGWLNHEETMVVICFLFHDVHRSIFTWE